MRTTAATLRHQEDAIFDALEHAPGDETFLGRLYRDGVPSPDEYLAQAVRVLFVFREPNLGGRPHALDMRDEVQDERFRPLGPDGGREERAPSCWWNWKAGMFAHAVGAALADEPWEGAFLRFRSGGWNHGVVNRFAYVQIKKVGGGGVANAAQICAHAAKYAGVLAQQVSLYEPHLVLGCGTGRDSPAALLARYVLPGGRKAVTRNTGATWWAFSTATPVKALVQLWHPARRGSQSELYQDVWASVHEVVRALGLPRCAESGRALSRSGRAQRSR